MTPSIDDSADPFADDKTKQPWLSILLRAYDILNQGIATAIERELKQGRKLACANGCSACCHTHQDIPVYPLELVGISWYATEKVSGNRRTVLKHQLKHYTGKGACPFLVDNSCSIHIMRPFACRQFNVFGKACDTGEDAYHTRPQDVLRPIKKFTDKAFETTLPFYGIKNKPDKKRFIKSGAIHQTVRTLQSCHWPGLAEKMQHYDDHVSLSGEHGSEP